MPQETALKTLAISEQNVHRTQPQRNAPKLSKTDPSDEIAWRFGSARRDMRLRGAAGAVAASTFRRARLWVIHSVPSGCVFCPSGRAGPITAILALKLALPNHARNRHECLSPSIDFWPNQCKSPNSMSLLVGFLVGMCTAHVTA